MKTILRKLLVPATFLFAVADAGAWEVSTDVTFAEGYARGWGFTTILSPEPWTWAVAVAKLRRGGGVVAEATNSSCDRNKQVYTCYKFAKDPVLLQDGCQYCGRGSGNVGGPAQTVKNSGLICDTWRPGGGGGNIP